MKKIAMALRHDLRRALGALAYAHTAEMLPPSAKGRILNGVPVSSAPPAQVNEDVDVAPRRRVALALNGHLDPTALRYAMQAAARFDADLHVLTTSGDVQMGPELDGGADQRARIASVVQLESDVMTGIAEYTRRYPETLFVVASANDELAERYVAERPAGWNPQVPWVVVSGQSRAA